MQVGDQTLTNLTCLVLSPENFASAKAPVDGILGMDILEDHACLLDMAKKQVTLWGSGALTPSDLKGLDMTDAVAVPLTPDGEITVYSALAKLTNAKSSMTEKLLLDTSAPSTYVSGDIVTKLGLPSVDASLQLPGTGTTYTISHTLVPEVSLGSLSLHDVRVAYAVGAEPPGLLHRLGIAFFSQNCVLFDFAHKVMYVKPIAPSIPAATTPTAPAPVPEAGSH